MIRSIRAAVADDSLPWLGTDRRAAGTHQSTVTRLEVGPNYERPLVGPLTISVCGGGIRGPFPVGGVSRSGAARLSAPRACRRLRSAGRRRQRRARARAHRRLLVTSDKKSSAPLKASVREGHCRIRRAWRYRASSSSTGVWCASYPNGRPHLWDPRSPSGRLPARAGSVTPRRLGSSRRCSGWREP
jgi:hypothetical protein